MMKQTACMILTVLLGGCMLHASAQQGFYVPAKGKIFFKGDTATIFSNVQNAGKIGMGKKAVVNFKGKKWENETQSMITDESDAGEGVKGDGGLIRFTGNETQELDGGFNSVTRTGPAFHRLQLINPLGLHLSGSSTRIRQELLMEKGHVFLNDQLLVIGDGNPGLITGYDPSRYIVTGNKPGSGLLIRENITMKNGIVVFPIGSRAGSYTPAALRVISGNGDDYYMNVFDSVRQLATSGANLQNNSVNKTWEAGKLLHPGEDETEIVLQHLIADEGSLFNANRKLSYISAWINNQWDTFTPQQLPVPGRLTSNNTVLANSGMNSRLLKNGTGSDTYFTKFTGLSLVSPQRTKVWLNVYRTGWDKVKVYWTTNPEVNNHYFVVQRRLSNESDFRNIDSVYSSTLNGNSPNYLQYSIYDGNNYAGNSFYRLRVTDRKGDYFYSNIAVAGGKPGGFQLLLWPNPSTGAFYLGINGAAVVKTVIIRDILGRMVHEEEVSERTIIGMRLYIPGTYLVSFISFGNQILETKKLVIQPY